MLVQLLQEAASLLKASCRHSMPSARCESCNPSTHRSTPRESSRESWPPRRRGRRAGHSTTRRWRAASTRGRGACSAPARAAAWSRSGTRPCRSRRRRSATPSLTRCAAACGTRSTSISGRCSRSNGWGRAPRWAPIWARRATRRDRAPRRRGRICTCPLPPRVP